MSDLLSPTAQDYLRGQITQPTPDNLKPPKNILTSIQGARALYFQYRTQNLPRVVLYAQIEGLIAGNPPYDPGDLAANRLSHLANFNPLDARATYEKAALAYWNLLNETEMIADFKLDIEIPQSIEWSDTIARHFNDVVRSWESFNVVFNTLAAQIVKFGISPVLWTDERDWRWRTIELNRFFVEDQAQTDMDLLTTVCVESIWTAQFLYEVYTQFEYIIPKAKKEDGTWDYTVCPWNLTELSNLLLAKANTWAKTEFNSQFFDFMDLQRKIQNNDLNFNAVFSDSFRIVSHFQKECDDKVSHYMYDRIYDAGNFLYFADRQYEKMQEGILIFTASPGEFTIHSNRGVGHKIFSTSQALMQLDNSMVDMARMAATPLLKTINALGKDFEPIRFYPGVATNIGAAEFQQNTMGENINQLIGLSQYLSAKLQANLTSSGDEPAAPDVGKGSLSPAQAKAQDYKEFGVSKNNIAHFYTQFTTVIRNMVIKMLRSKKGWPGYEFAKRWKDRCIRDGVPAELFSVRSDSFELPPLWSVEASRAAGDGSTLARIMGLQELGPIAGDFGPNETFEYKKQWIMATMGKSFVYAFTQDSKPEGDSDSLASVENAIMRLGESPQVSVSNNQKGHFVAHLALGNDTMRRRHQQQMSSVEADKIFTVLIPHMDEHMQIMMRSPFSQAIIEDVKKPYSQLKDYAVLNHKNATKELEAALRKQQEQQEQTQQVLNDEQLKNLKAQGDENRANIKVQSQVQRASEANQTRAEVMREKVQLDAQNKRLAVQYEGQAKTLKAQQDAVEELPIDELRSQIENGTGGVGNPDQV